MRDSLLFTWSTRRIRQEYFVVFFLYAYRHKLEPISSTFLPKQKNLDRRSYFYIGWSIVIDLILRKILFPMQIFIWYTTTIVYPFHLALQAHKKHPHIQAFYPTGMVCGIKCKKYKTLLARGNSEKILVNHSCGGGGGEGGAGVCLQWGIRMKDFGTSR